MILHGGENTGKVTGVHIDHWQEDDRGFPRLITFMEPCIIPDHNGRGDLRGHVTFQIISNADEGSIADPRGILIYLSLAFMVFDSV